MMPKKVIRFTRAQRIMDKIMNNYNSTDDVSSEGETRNQNNDTECPISPLPSGAEYAVEDLSLELLAHRDLQQIITEDNLQTSPIDESITCNTPMPSPPMSFSAYSTLENSLENIPFTNSDYLTSTPELAEPIDDNYENPSSIISSDIQSIPSASEPAIYSSSDVLSPSLKNRKKKYTKRKDIGRLRQKYQKEWVDMKRKRLKNLGLQYQSRDGKLRHAKSLGAIKCYPKCVYKCYEKFTDAQRQRLFDRFWAVGDHSKQWDILARYIQKQNKRRTISENSRRSFTYTYYLPVLDGENNTTLNLDVDHELKHRVCKSTFLQTFVVSEKVVRTAIAKCLGELMATDQRGNHMNHPVVTTDAMIESVLDHVKSYVPVESHYCRKDTSRVYLDGSLTFRRMYTMYNEWFDSNKYPSKCRSLRQYRDIINKNVNLGFHKPKKDLCDTCQIFKNTPEPNEDIKLAYATHINNKNLARFLKTEDKKQAALRRENIFCACYDMQKILYCPHGDVSIFYYKMKLKLYNFTAFDIDKLQGFCYLWSEQDGKKGPNEIASFVYDLIEKKSKEGYNDFRFWSDNCSSQNRNRIVFFMYSYAAKKININIKHSYLEKGHTQSEVDSMHATIEKAAKNKIIYTPNEWNSLIRWSKQTGETYTVIDVTQEIIFDFKKMQRSPIYNWTKTTNGDQVKWSKIKQVIVSHDTPDTLIFKYDLAEDATEYNINIKPLQKKVRRTRLSNQTNIPAEPNLTKCYNGLLPITKEKKKDLMSMCSAKVIPAGHHGFFSNLTVLSSADQIENLSSDEE